MMLSTHQMPNPALPDRLINLNVNSPLPQSSKINEIHLQDDAERKAKRRDACLKQHQRKELLLKHNYSILPNLVTRVLSTAMLLKDEYIDRIILERTALLDAVAAQEKKQEQQEFIMTEMQKNKNALDANERKPVYTASSYSSPIAHNRPSRASSLNNNNNNNNSNTANESSITSRSSFSEITSAIFNRTMNLTRYGFSSAENNNNNNNNSASNRNNNNTNTSRNTSSNANAPRSSNNNSAHGNNNNDNNESSNSSNINTTNNPDAIHYNFTSSSTLVEASQDDKRAFETEISGRIAKLAHANLLSQSDSASFDAAMMNVIEELFAESLHLQPSSVNKENNYDDAEPARKARSLEMNMVHNYTNAMEQNAFAKKNSNALRIALSPDELRIAEDNWSNSVLLIKRPTRYYCLWTGAVMGGSASVDKSFPLALRNGSIISNQFILQHKPSVKHMTALQVAKSVDTKGANEQRTNFSFSDLDNLNDEIVTSLSRALEAELNTHTLNSSTMNVLGIHRVFVT